jgi:hypothetical protein
VQAECVIHSVHWLFSEVIVLSENSCHFVLGLFRLMGGSAVLVAIPICLMGGSAVLVVIPVCLMGGSAVLVAIPIRLMGGSAVLVAIPVCCESCTHFISVYCR